MARSIHDSTLTNLNAQRLIHELVKDSIIHVDYSAIYRRDDVDYLFTFVAVFSCFSRPASPRLLSTHPCPYSSPFSFLPNKFP